MTIFPHAQNFVKTIVYNECTTPFGVYVETFFPAFIRMLIAVNYLQWTDIIRMIAEAKAAPRGSRSARSLRHRINRALAGNPVEQERFSQKGLRHLLTITQPLETIGFVWMLYALTDQFYLDWQTGIMFNSGCFHPAAAGPFQRSRGNIGNLPILPSGAASSLPDLVQDRAGWGSGVFSVGVPPGTYQAVYAANVLGPNGGTPSARASLRVTNSLSSPTILGPDVALGSREASALTVQAQFGILAPGGSIGWELTGNAVPVGLNCTGAKVIIFRTG